MSYNVLMKAYTRKQLFRDVLKREAEGWECVKPITRTWDTYAGERWVCVMRFPNWVE